MGNAKFQNKYRIKSARAKWHKYNGGIYFITICTKNREHFFGEIENNNMRLSEIGIYASENLQNITNHYSYAEIPLFVVMPNHIHAIVIIDGNIPNARCRDVARNVSTVDVCNVPTVDARNVSTVDARNDCTKTNKKPNEKMIEIAKHQSLLCITIRGFKSAITKFARKNNIDFVWQTRFHDHIVRNQNELNRIADYIENNPRTWNSDSLNEK